MAGLCWMAVTLAFFLSTENSFAAVDQNRLASIVNGILKAYRTEGMFSLAVSIPDDQNRKISDILQQVFQSDPVEDVAKQLDENKLYVGNRVVAAIPLPLKKKKTDHAESRVADYLVHLFNRRDENDLLLFYVYASPCVDKCTNNLHSGNILGRINLIQQWKSHAFVFSKIFKPLLDSKKNTKETKNPKHWVNTAIGRLGSVVGLDNIFRCERENGWMQCISCSSNDQVTQACVSDTNTQPQQVQVGSEIGGGRGGGQGGSGRGGGRGGGQGGSGRGGGRGGGGGGIRVRRG